MVHWNPPQPRELPAWRADLAERMQSQIELETHANVLAHGKGTLHPPASSPIQAAQILLDEEYNRLANAELYFVSADMSRLAVAAGASLPDYQVAAEDLPTTSGLMVFGEPIGGYLNTDADDEWLPIVAVSWGLSGAVPSSGGTWLTFWTPGNHEWIARRLHRNHGVSMPQARRTARRMRGDLAWDNEALLSFGANEVTVADATNPIAPGRVADDTSVAGESTVGWVQAVRAAWLLMTQPGVTDVAAEHVSKSVRRRAERDGYRLDDIRVVRIRHRADSPHPAGEATEGRTYRVRWAVRGHWRNQWYPSQERHRPLWINPHIKGPDGAPLHTSDTVHVLDG